MLQVLSLGIFLPSDLNSQFFIQVISTKNIFRSKNLGSKLAEMDLRFITSPGVVPNEIDFHAGLLHSAFQSKLLLQRKMQIGEVGCALAHRNALNYFLKSGHKFGIVFEDDAEIIRNFNLDSIRKILDSNFPVVIALGWIPGFAIAKNPQDLFSEEPIELITSPTCTFAYAINHLAAELLINGQKKIIDVADWPIYLMKKVKFYAVHSHSPWVTANHDPKFSTIGERSGANSKNQITVLISRIRLVSSLLTLILLAKTNKLDVSPKQIVHRILIRDMLFKHGNSQSTGENRNVVIPAPLKFQKLLESLRLI